MDGNFNLSNWLVAAVSESKKSGATSDIHIDEITAVEKNNSSQNIEVSMFIFKYVVELLSNIDVEGVGVFLSIELKPDSVFGNAPKNIEEVVLQYDASTMPEIIVYKPFRPELPNKLQFYRCPLLFFDVKQEDKFSVFYKEYRTLDEVAEGEDFHRELNIEYIPS